MLLLSVGGGSDRRIPPGFDGAELRVLDIDPNCSPDYCVDTLEIEAERPDLAGLFDAVYCSHNLEHYYRHDVPRVLSAFQFVLKAGGRVEIRVPNVATLFKVMLANDLDLDDTWYRVSGGEGFVSRRPLRLELGDVGRQPVLRTQMWIHTSLVDE